LRDVYQRLKSAVPARTRALIKAAFNLDSRSFYSQFGEDAFVYSYFLGQTWTVKAQMCLPANGTYIEIGAYSPTECSNTYAFYKRGWRGINVDAAPGVMDSFKVVRCRDVNLNVAVGSQPGKIPFFCWGVPSVFNTADPDIALERARSLGRDPDVVLVDCVRLDQLLQANLRRDLPFRLMSVDVEGRDLDVLMSNDWDKFRPEVLVAEHDAGRVDDVVRSELYEFVIGQRYELIGWLRPSLIFRDAVR
jgi:FkbM family methyltransferase